MKIHELSDSASCFNKAEEREMLFVLLGRDAASPSTIRFWCQERVRLGKNVMDDPQIKDAMSCAHQVDLDLRQAQINQTQEMEQSG